MVEPDINGRCKENTLLQSRRRLLKLPFANMISRLRRPDIVDPAQRNPLENPLILHSYAWRSVHGGPCAVCAKGPSGGNHIRNNAGFVTDTAGNERCAFCNIWAPCPHRLSGER